MLFLEIDALTMIMLPILYVRREDVRYQATS